MLSAPANPVIAVILAAGLGTRMRGPNKLLEAFEGQPIVRHVALAALASRADRVAVVLGHEANRVREALQDLDVDFVDNPDYQEGMAASIRSAVASHGIQASALVFCLADMPRVSAEVINALIDAHHSQTQPLACQPVHEGRRGNPVLWASAAFPELLRLTGAEGARILLEKHRDHVKAVDVNCAGILLDIDTAADLAVLRSQSQGQA